MSDFPRNLPGYGSGFIKLLQKYGPEKGRILITMHIRLGELLDARPPKYTTNPVPISYADLKAIHDLLLDQVFAKKVLPDNVWGMDNAGDPARQISTIDQCRWAYSQGLITEGEFENTKAFIRKV